MINKKLADIFEWDAVNWSRHIDLWEEVVKGLDRPKTGLEIGSRGGGLSLWMGLAGLDVTCSYYDEDITAARKLHANWEIAANVSYQRIDVLEMDYSNRFDVIMMKSTLGGLNGTGDIELQRQAIERIYGALRPGGALLFAENVAGSVFHSSLRRIKRGHSWRYPTLGEVEMMLALFQHYQYRTTGVISACGKSEAQRRFLGHFDGYLSRIVPNRWHYVCMGAALK